MRLTGNHGLTFGGNQPENAERRPEKYHTRTGVVLYLIKDLSRLSGHSIHTLKFYLKRGLISETGRSPETRFRYFNDTTLARLAQIRTYRRQHKSLNDIQHLLLIEDRSRFEAQTAALGSRPKALGSYLQPPATEPGTPPTAGSAKEVSMRAAYRPQSPEPSAASR